MVSLMGGDAVETDALNIVDGHGKSVGGDEVGGTGLEFQRGLLEGGFLETDGVNHLTAALIGGHAVEPFLTSIKYADAGGTVHLVPAEGQEVTAQCLHVDGYVGSALRSVEQDGDSMIMVDAEEVGDGFDGAEHVAHMGDADEARAVGEQPLIFLQEELAVVVDGNHLDLYALAVLQELPGHDVGVVLHDRENDFITG